MDGGEILLIVDVEDAIRKHSDVEDLGEVVSQVPCMAQRCNVLAGVLKDGMVGHYVGGWRGEGGKEWRREEVGGKKRKMKKRGGSWSQSFKTKTKNFCM